NGCLNPVSSAGNWSDVGFASRIYEGLVDPDDGIITVLRGGGNLSLDQQRMVGMIPGSTGAMVVRLSSVSDSAVETFAREAAYQLAIEMTSQMLRELHMTLTRALAGIDDPDLPRVEDIIADSFRANQRELARLQRRHGNVEELLSIYSGFFGVIQPNAEFSTVGFSSP
ncbi:MAG: hypothetical protein AAFV86_18980, partial [Pseudomonadota bacterium]